MTEEKLALPGAEFSFCKDGDLQIELTATSYDERWTGTFLDREQTLKLRDYLNRMFP